MNAGRYGRIFLSFARNCLVRDMTFRTNFLIKVFSDLLTLGIMLAFFGVIFLKLTRQMAGWSMYQVLLLVGTHHLINKISETLFVTNMHELSEQIRTGELDFVLTKPISTQFMVSMRKINYSGLVNLAFGIILVVYAAARLDTTIGTMQVLQYLLLIGVGVVIAYSVMFVLSATSVWIVRGDWVFECWFYFNRFARYPGEIYQSVPWLRIVLTYGVPVLIMTNFPAKTMWGGISGLNVAFAVAIAGLLLWLSHWFFQFALRSYRSASS